ncbi:histidine kinase [Nocardia tengchongensis]|uniref:histidine kinase n=1 Tax=Nocardia tengchongensis TaxID=2055889 RepID=A0ABX8CME5_9NOCA|nr:histidine kinase [Nocardia tengchongensis]QVI21065.1 histidine kinase [Nocardia tengchongensis]
MNVTSATPAALGQELSEGLRRVGVGVRRFARNPYADYQRWVEATGFDYPASMAVLVDLMMYAVATTAFAQRIAAGYFPSAMAAAALILALATGLPCIILDIKPRPALLAGLTMAAVALFLTQPVPLDAAPLILILIAGEIAAITPTTVSVAVGLAMFAELLFFKSVRGVDGFTWFSVGILFAWFTGQLLNYQRRYLYQERDYQDIRARAAADEERRHIAREVHDVIAHSLSITLLHVTAARHALQTDRDVDEAIDALSDAERLGRQAMADIRRTVGLLGERSAPQRPEPGVEDIGDLVSDFVRAGMPIDFEADGDPTEISAALGLALYRVCQESLANVAKHAQGAHAQVRILAHARHIELTVTNTLPAGAAARPGRGMGISGMRQRLAALGGTLTSGPADGGWQVKASIPTTSQWPCVAAAEHGLRTAVQAIIMKPQEGV